MKIFIRPEELRDIEEHGEKAYPNEGVGFLFGRDNGNELVVEAARPVENRRETEAQINRYEVSPQDFMWAEGEAERLGMDLIGVFHSHPDHPAQPSQFDLDHAMPHFSYLITSIEKGKATLTRAWQLQTDREVFGEDMLVVGVASTIGR